MGQRRVQRHGAASIVFAVGLAVTRRTMAGAAKPSRRIVRRIAATSPPRW
jgi:hypothetical protein